MLYNTERPYTFDQMAGQKFVVESIRRQALKEQFMGVYIFHGQYGSGKTTMARILALAANCPKDERGNPDYTCQTAKDILSGNCADFMEIDGASKTGVEEVRKLIEDTAYQPYLLKRKVYVIDEVHMLSKASFHALLKTLEEPPEYAIFILCTTEFKAIPATIKSRAACYCFSKISNEDITAKLMEICARHGIRATEEACILIAKNADGSLRNAESLLEQASISHNGSITEEDVGTLIGISDPSELTELLKNIVHGNVGAAAEAANRLLAEGKNLHYMADDMIEMVSDAIILSYGGECSLLQASSHYQDLIKDLVSHGTSGDFIRLSKELLKLNQDLRSGLGKTALLVSIIQMASPDSKENTKLHQLEAEMEAVKQKLDLLSAKQPVQQTYNSQTENPPDKPDDSFTMFQEFQLFHSLFEEDASDVDQAQEVLDRIEQIAEDDAAFFAAVYEGAKSEVSNGCVTYTTPLKPIETLLKKYFDVFSIPAKVVFNKEVTI